MRLILCVVSLIVIGSLHAEPLAPTPRGEQMIRDYMRIQAKQISDACLKDVRTKDDWEKQRPILRQQFFEMMGLSPLPAKTPLKPVIVETIEMPKYTIEKLHFQSIPGLYVTGNLYVPNPAPKNAPTILYMCGHADVKKDGIFFGNKIHYQHHPAWYAENGYVCLIIDTLQLGEIRGLHHGTHNLGMWWWQTLGYTPAGIELWNAIRALDYLETRPEVDRKRIGATGRSGGGATSWWIAAADDRIACAVPVAGIADLYAQICDGGIPKYKDGVITGHCDCMFFINTYRWDFATVAALIAPRPLLLGNTDQDEIFPVPGYRRLADQVRPIYHLYGADEKFALLEGEGPHKDTPLLQRGSFRWMNRWLKNDNAEVDLSTFKPLPPERLKVTQRIPGDSINATLHEVFRKPAKLELPTADVVKWWDERKPELMKSLRDQVFRGWAKESPIESKMVADVKFEGTRLRAYDFVSEQGIELRLWLKTAVNTEKPSLVVLNVLDEAGYAEWAKELGAEFAEVLQLPKPIERDAERFKQEQRVMEKQKWAFAAITPRGVGPTRWAEPESKIDVQIRRRFALIGQTLDGQRVWDVRRALAAMRVIPELKEVPMWVQAKNEMAGIALYASLFEPDIARLDLWSPSVSHQTGPTFLHVRTYLDMPQAMALAFPKPIRLYVENEADAKKWDWPNQVQKAYGQEYLKVRVIPK